MKYEVTLKGRRTGKQVVVDISVGDIIQEDSQAREIRKKSITKARNLMESKDGALEIRKIKEIRTVPVRIRTLGLGR